jgi:indolepyruvate decarboxylase
MSQTVIQHVLRRLTEIGLTDVFGVPGDFAFPVNDAICAPDSGLRWIGTANELNAGYAADGYARVRGFSAVCTTYGVGELAAPRLSMCRCFIWSACRTWRCRRAIR